MFCTNCGQQLADGIKFCIYCGTPVQSQESPVGAQQTPVQPMIDPQELQEEVQAPVQPEPVYTPEPEPAVPAEPEIPVQQEPQWQPQAPVMPDAPVQPQQSAWQPQQVPQNQWQQPKAPQPQQAPQNQWQPQQPAQNWQQPQNQWQTAQQPVTQNQWTGMEPEPEPKKSKLWLLIVAGVVVLAGIVTAIILLLGKGKDGKDDSSESSVIVEESSQVEESSEISQAESSEEASQESSEESSEESSAESSAESSEESSAESSQESSAESSAESSQESSAEASQESSSESQAESSAPATEGELKIVTAKNGLTITVPSGLTTVETGSGIMGTGSDMIIYASFFDTDLNGAGIYGIEDFRETLKKYPDMLTQMMGVESITIGETQEEVQLADRHGDISDFTISYEDFSGKGKVYLMEDNSNYGIFLMYYVAIDQGKNPAQAAEQAEEAIKSVTAPEVIGSKRLYYMPDDKSFIFCVEEKYTDSYISVDTSRLALVLLNAAGEERYISVEKEDMNEYGLTTADDYMNAYAEAMGHPGPTILQYTTGGYPFRYMISTYTKDDGQELTYLFATFTTGGGIFYTIYAEGSAEEVETLFPPVIDNILWTFHIGALSGY